jgi:hypothetical protein
MITSFVTAWMLGCVNGFFIGVLIAIGRRKPPNRHGYPRMGPPYGSYGLNEGTVQRGNNNDGPTTIKPQIIAKPQFPPPQKIREGIWFDD